MSSAPLFQPTTLGAGIQLQHRVVLSPLTRLRTDENQVPLLPLVKEYYTQRASTVGTLLITESTFVAAKAGGYPYMPGIWNQNQINAWKEIVDSVHAKGSFIFLQLLALGRGAMPAVLRAIDPSFPYVGASDIPVDPSAEERPRPLTIAETAEYVELYKQATKNAVEAGFDGIEIHNANGCLLDQFIQDVSNNRTDDYGGSIENRSRMTLEVVKAVAEIIGEERVSIRFSPWSPFAGMGMKDPVPTFSYILEQLKSRHPRLAYIHLIEPRIAANESLELTEDNASQSNEHFHKIWAGDGTRKIIRTGGFTRQSALEFSERNPNNGLVAFGRQFIANPDLPLRLKHDVALNPYDRATFYLPGNEPRGYTDQPFAKELDSLRG
ncbi:NADH:flavin oxidoreductase/NADH oxidase [Mycena indigotica]|uniref:NADH:flavin oxidoreductase/NADH oxidase n=1 Tax=Mycena indigotica TaxID=2126181 RepID=A0A8H6VYD6_9AGAR|nr:NADH:flavin oxidoreductase/NADH oxidase [Mycena indigotica]KAF7298694.1 NADH:flavin oxidoreductase/NADH oxidase [Mycena indigotica]